MKFDMISAEKQKIIDTFKPKILGIRNYRSLKKEFFVKDFLDLHNLDSFIEEVSCGESDITPAGKVFLERYYGLTELPDLILGSMSIANREKQRDRVISNMICLESPMETMTFIERARGNVGKDFSFREDLLPPEIINKNL